MLVKDFLETLMVDTLTDSTFVVSYNDREDGSEIEFETSFFEAVRDLVGDRELNLQDKDGNNEGAIFIEGNKITIYIK